MTKLETARPVGTIKAVTPRYAGAPLGNCSMDGGSKSSTARCVRSRRSPVQEQSKTTLIYRTGVLRDRCGGDIMSDTLRRRGLRRTALLGSALLTLAVMTLFAFARLFVI